MSSVGQLSDPFQNKQDDEFEDVSISGMPLEPDEPPPEQADDDEAPGDGDVVYDLDDWSDMERQAVTDRLREAGIPHAWDGTELHVAAEDEAPVENILDLVEGESAGDEEDAEDEAEALDASRDQVAYDLAEWDDDLLTTLVRELRSAGVAYAWDGDELYVYADDEQAADELLDRVAHPHELPPEPDDESGGAELLGEIFVAADRLQHDGGDHEGTVTMLDMSHAIEGAAPPYGLGEPEWKHVCERVASLGALLRADKLDEDAVMDAARDLRTALRPFV
jgi:hypothetical protein